MAVNYMKTSAQQLQLKKLLYIGNRYFYTSNINEKKSESWFNKFIPVRKIEPGKDSHSRLLSSTEKVYEIQIHDVKPGHMKEYLNKTEKIVSLMTEKEKNARLVGNWVVDVGNQDQSVTIWCYNEGYSTATNASVLMRKDEDLSTLNEERVKLLSSRINQYLLAFSFWKDALPREGPHIYELRTYALKPGTMIEWGNNWARAIHYRQAYNEAVGGYFSQVGKLYHVYHVWAYESLSKRKEIREATWRNPGWDQNVAYTVPLIETMQSRVMIPSPFSPLQ